MWTAVTLSLTLRAPAANVAAFYAYILLSKSAITIAHCKQYRRKEGERKGEMAESGRHRVAISTDERMSTAASKQESKQHHQNSKSLSNRRHAIT